MDDIKKIKRGENFLQDFPSAGEMKKYTERGILSEKFLKEVENILSRMRAAKEPMITVGDMSEQCLNFLKSKGYSTKETLLLTGKYYCEVSW